MGVTGLWTVVQPCARPIKLETLNKKRLAVDASIWIYQFLKAVRDKEGNALRNSHVVGFFRRICKLLFVGIQPVFVFDGGAPALKRQTISSRKRRREGRREDATRTAGKLLALQMQRRAEEDEEKRKRVERQHEDEEEDVPENVVYVDELQMTNQERQQNRKFRKKDQYHLPDLEGSLAEMGGPNDPRVMSLEELETYARQFDTGEDINVYDFSKIDFESQFFVSLPASDRYNILNAARLRSRLRMGYSKEQLDTMFPDRMAFSKFQIDRVRERNELTQRLMNINGMNDDAMFGVNGTGRVAGEKGREYVLVKNDGVEGGWALGVVTSKEEGRESKPIDVDALGKTIKTEESDEDDEEDFEDVPIEGLNRLPKRSASQQDVSQGARPPRQRRALYGSSKSRKSKKTTLAPNAVQEDPDSLFVGQVDDEEAEGEEDDMAEDADLFGDEDEDEETQRAIALSLQQDTEAADQDVPDNINYLELFEQRRADEARPVPKGSGMSIAHVVNSRANKAAPLSAPFAEADSDDDGMEFEDIIGEARADRDQRAALKPEPRAEREVSQQKSVPAQPPAKQASKSKGAFDGPLPFEKLDLGSSLLGKKKMQDLQEGSSGGFEKESDKKKDQDAQPLPPWFAGNLNEDIAAQRKIEREDREKAKEFDKSYQFTQPTVMRRHVTGDVIDLEAADGTKGGQEVIAVDEDDKSDEEGAMAERNGDGDLDETTVMDAEDDDTVSISMGDMADAVRGEPPQPKEVPKILQDPEIRLNNDDTEEEQTTTTEINDKPAGTVKDKDTPPTGGHKTQAKSGPFEEDEEEDELEWSASDREESEVAQGQPSTAPGPSERVTEPAEAPERSPSPDFEDVQIPDEPAPAPAHPHPASHPPRESASDDLGKDHVSGTVDENAAPEQDGDEFGYYSDSEDDELMRQLAVEAEEHARFASTLNHKTQEQNIQDYENELKQLRSQQKKDRRDADEVTQIMITECQQLLKLFGLPYITAPMEAEAQCAELVQLGLVDGIVTDDSDCFLFGGTRIYKNMFNQAKFVECYLASDLEKEFDLTRQKLISIAQLLGSDYTEGLPGVGPVSALEILSEFPSLAEFRDWWQAVQMNQIPKSDDASNPFRKKFRKNATKLFLPPAFPDPRVDLAYAEPEVDSDPSQFQWGVPDLDRLRSFLMATIGWSQERTDEVLVPVIRDMNRRMDEGTQSNITKFFGGGTGSGAYAPRKKAEQSSKRLGSALDRLARKAEGKRKAGRMSEADEQVVEAAEGEDEVADTEIEHSGPKKKKAKSRKGTAKRSKTVEAA